MLINFSLENISSFKTTQNISMEASNLKKDAFLDENLIKNKDKKAEIIEQRNKEVSKLRITSLWKSYCLDEPQEQECAGVV
jgi:hypothetical protein